MECTGTWVDLFGNQSCGRKVVFYWESIYYRVAQDVEAHNWAIIAGCVAVWDGYYLSIPIWLLSHN